MKGIIYTRVSSEEQVDGTSLDVQMQLCTEYCARKGIEVIGRFREEGASAKDLSLKNRPQFLAALDFCRKHKDVKAFVVVKVDRFARNTEDHFAVRRILMTSGTSLHSVTEPIGNKPAEKFIETVLAGAAEYDNAIRKQRCTDGMLARIHQGIWPFRPPVGYACAHHRQKREKKTVPDEPDPRVFPIVQRALRAYGVGEISSQIGLVHQLNTWGFEAAAGKRATPQLVDRLLGRYLPFYAGVLVNPWTGAECPGLHIPLISPAELAKIRLRRFGAQTSYPATRNHFNSEFPLRRLLRCVDCNGFLTGARSRGNGGTYSYYYCTTKGCARRSKCLRATVLHDCFEAYLASLHPSAVRLDEFKGRFKCFLQARDEGQSQRASRMTKLDELQKRRLRVLEMREDGTYDAEMLRERLRVIDAATAELKSVEERWPDLSVIDIEQACEAAARMAATLCRLWQTLSVVARARFERVFFPNGLIYAPETGFRTTSPGLVFALLGIGSEPVSHEVLLKGITSNQLQEYLNDLLELNRIAIEEPILEHDRAA